MLYPTWCCSFPKWLSVDVTRKIITEQLYFLIDTQDEAEKR